jgi:DNA-binding response OmpR family regulator
MESLDAGARKPKIVVIDDDRGTAELIQMMLRARGYDVELIYSGAKAIELFERLSREASPWYPLPIDLVLLDIMMPGVDGFKVCQTIKHDPLLKYVPVIMVTALDNASDKVTAVEFGADDYITKPFLPEELRAAIKAKLQVKQREMELVRRNTELAAINAVITAATNSLDPRRVAEAAFAALMANTNLAGAAIYILDETQTTLQLMDQVRVNRPQFLPISEGVSGQVFQSQHPILKVDLQGDPDAAADALCDGEMRSFAGVPLRGVEQSLGILEVYQCEPYGLDESAVSFYLDIGDRIGIALQNAEIFQRAQMLLLESSTLNANSA